MVCMCDFISLEKQAIRMWFYSLSDVVARGMAYFGQGNGSIHLNSIVCSGAEEKLINCSSTDERTCDHSEDAGVQCGGEIMLCHSAINTIIYSQTVVGIYDLL